MSPPKIAIFYHLYPNNLPLHKWGICFDEQISKICSSGLYDVCDFIHIGVNAKSDGFELPYTLNKFKIQFSDNFLFEFDTLKSLYKFCTENPDYKVYYFNNKGITYIDTYLQFITNSWRIYLEHFMISKWKDNLDLLDNHDVVCTEHSSNILGSFISSQQKNYGHIGGNFWWARADYVSKLSIDFFKKNTIEQRGIKCILCKEEACLFTDNLYKQENYENRKNTSCHLRLLAEQWVTDEECRIYNYFSYKNNPKSWMGDNGDPSLLRSNYVQMYNPSDYMNLKEI